MWKNCNQSHFMPPVEKRTECSTAVKEINHGVEPGNIKECVVLNCFKYFEEDNTNLKDKTKSKRHSVLEDEVILEIVKQQPRTSKHIINRTWFFIEHHQLLPPWFWLYDQWNIWNAKKKNWIWLGSASMTKPDYEISELSWVMQGTLTS